MVLRRAGRRAGRRALSCRLWYDVVMVVIISKKKEEKLAELVREFFATHPGIKIIAVTGSAGKASAKIVVAHGVVVSDDKGNVFRIHIMNVESEFINKIENITPSG